MESNLLLVLLVVLCCAQYSLGQPKPSTGNVGGIEVEFDGSIYLFSLSKTTSFEAFLYCNRYGGKLAEIDAPSVQQFLLDTVGRTNARQYWFGAYRSGAISTLNAWLVDPGFFIDCNNPLHTVTCQTNTPGPFLGANFATSCFADQNCTGDDIQNQNETNLSFFDWAPGQPSAEPCAYVDFRDCSIIEGCSTSAWFMDACQEQRHFVCQKSSCPNMDPPISLGNSTNSNDVYRDYLGVNLVCGMAAASLSVNHCALQGIDIQNARIGTTGDACFMDDGQFFTIHPIAGCGAMGQDEGYAFAYSYDLYLEAFFGTGSNADVIKRIEVVEVSLVCNITNKFEMIPNNTAIEPFRRVLDLYPGNLYGGFSVSAFLFEDDTFSVPVSNISVSVPEPVYVGLQVADVDPEKFILQLVHCTALTPCYCNFLDLISLGCATPGVTIVNDRVGARSSFKFNSFLFADDPSLLQENVMVICDVIICDTEITNCTAPAVCMKRKKRQMLRKGETLVQVQVGNIQVNPARSCQYDNGGCSHVCSDREGAASCFCPDHLALSSDGLTCLLNWDTPKALDEVVYNEDDELYANEFAEEGKEEQGQVEDEGDYVDVSILLLVMSALMCALASFLTPTQQKG